jgi:quercetin dioxygenase-like cupin family protein
MMPSVPTLLTPAEGVRFSIGPFAITGRVLGSQSGGAFELYELTLGEATIDYHVHMTMDETICVIAGEIEFTVAGQKFTRPAGSVAFIPRGVHHGFTNHGPAQATVLVLFTPGGNQDEYFRELERLFSAPALDLEALQALQKQFDQELVAAE